MQKLLSMTEFVLQNKANFRGYGTDDYGMFCHNHIVRTEKYANFLLQPITIEILVPCDRNGNIIEDPTPNGMMDNWTEKCREWNEAKSRVLFEGIKIEKGVDMFFIEFPELFKGFYNFKDAFQGWTIESLLKYKVNLSETAEKEYFAEFVYIKR